MDDIGIRHIVVAINGSRESQAALEHAAQLARVSNASLDLLAVASVPPTMYWGGAPQAMELVEQVYADLARRAAASISDVPVTTYLARGNPAGAILEHVERHGCDLIVLGSRGRPRALATLLRSTSQAVTRRARVPVVAVRWESGDDHATRVAPIAEAAA
jgi:nucleotide-binding universal stress UspA family protein